MNIREIVKKTKESFPNWTHHKEEVKEAINLIGMEFFDKFNKLGGQEQDVVLNVAIATARPDSVVRGAIGAKYYQ